MAEKRQFQRYKCKISLDFEFFEGNPDDIDVKTATPIKGKGYMLDISKGGAFIVTSSRVGINMPIFVHIDTKKDKKTVTGIIVRTGLLKNNPSEVAKRYADAKVKGDSYLAVQFNANLIEIDLNEMG